MVPRRAHTASHHTSHLARTADRVRLCRPQVKRKGEPCTLYVKGLAFATREPALRALFEERTPGAGAPRAITIARARQGSGGGGGGGSLGYGFVEFDDASAARAALRALDGALLDGKRLELRLSQKRASTARGDGGAEEAAPAGVAASRTAADKAHAEKSARTKLVVRNLAFQATVSELRALFGEYGTLKSVRLPKRAAGGSGGAAHRGFAFVDFLAARDARAAAAALTSTHLYGRRLVIEWAETEGQNATAGLR